MHSDLHEALLAELDFVQAARQQDWFRRAARKSGKRFFTAPRVIFELSNEEVLTQEFVAGMWLWELPAAVEQSNEEALTRARHLKIDPRQALALMGLAEAYRAEGNKDQAIRFYERYGFQIVGPRVKDHLLEKYWSISERQMETSVVLADAAARTLFAKEETLAQH